MLFKVFFSNCSVSSGPKLALKASVSTYKQPFPCLKVLSVTGLPQDVCEAPTCSTQKFQVENPDYTLLGFLYIFHFLSERHLVFHMFITP